MILQGILHKFTTYVNLCNIPCMYIFISFNMKGFYYEITKEKNFTNLFGYGISCW